MNELRIDDQEFHTNEEVTEVVVIGGGGGGGGGGDGPGTGPGTGSGGDTGGSSGSGGGSGNTGGSSVNEYKTPGASEAANKFASHVISNGMPETTHSGDPYVVRYIDDLSHLFDYSQSHPNVSINIGYDQQVSLSEVINLLNERTVFTILKDDGLGGNQYSGETGARTAYVPNGDDFYSIYLNPDNSNQQTYKNTYGDTGMDYNLFHEIGHAIGGHEHVEGRLTGDQMERSANTAGQSLADLLGLPGLTTSGGQHVDPNFGYAEW